MSAAPGSVAPPDISHAFGTTGCAPDWFPAIDAGAWQIASQQIHTMTRSGPGLSLLPALSGRRRNEPKELSQAWPDNSWQRHTVDFKLIAHAFALDSSMGFRSSIHAPAAETTIRPM